MGNDLLIAIVSAALAFFIFLKLIFLFNHRFSIDMPRWLVAIVCIIIAVAIYYKRQFLFSNPIITGLTIGIILAFLWNIKDTGLISGVLKGIFSYKFVLWCLFTALGIYKRAIIVDLWNEYIMTNAASARPYILILIILIYIFGSLFVLVPNFFIRRSVRGAGFSMNRKASTSKIVFWEILGVIMVLLSSTLLIEAYMFINKQ